MSRGLVHCKLSDVAQYCYEVGQKPTCITAVHNTVIVGQRDWKHGAGLECGAVPHGLGGGLADTQDAHLWRVYDLSLIHI